MVKSITDSCYGEADLRGLSRDGAVVELIAEGSKVDGWTLAFFLHDTKHYLKLKRNNAIRVFSSPLALFKFVKSMDCVLAISNLEVSMCSVATRLAALYVHAQLSPNPEDIEASFGMFSEPYLVTIEKNHFADVTKEQLLEAIKQCAVDPALFVSNLNAGLSLLANQDLEQLTSLNKDLLELGIIQPSFRMIVKGVSL